MSSALFLVLFLGAGLYADSVLQVLYVVLGFYGWWHWLHGGPRRDELPVTSASPRCAVALVVAAVVGTRRVRRRSSTRRPTRRSPTPTPRRPS